MLLDPAAAYPKVAVLRDALDAGDWPACRETLDTAEPVERTCLTTVAADTEGVTDFLRGVLSGDPSDGAAGALLGRHLAGAGDFVGAERVLVDAAARSPRDPAIWTVRLRTARSLRLGPSEARRRYDRLAEIDPHHVPGQSQFLRYLCGHDPAAAHEFAHQAADAAPPGSLNPVLVAEYHLDRYLAEGRHHFDDTTVRAELTEAADRSARHPDHRHTHGWVRVTSTFAMVFALLGDHPAAAGFFGTLGDLDSAQPWDRLGDPATVIGRYRKRATGGEQ
ncbi:tetratricopeptide repeat protein [Actinoplanes sp. G11-F43]|uniref:tetratricopeptide repeat protein n=1 Tax=Actinoplanes sp. G11-F43 TaxID=3424130 RepID=UPI003D357A02